MNNPHQNVRTTRLGRAEMIRHIIEDGQPVREVARGFGISERTARKWLARYRAEGPRPRIGQHRVQLNHAQLLALVDGMDWKRVHAVTVRAPQSVG